jgi:hypothetical protein
VTANTRAAAASLESGIRSTEEWDVRLRVRTMLWASVPIAVALGIARYVLFTYLEINGPQISLLSVGERVVIYSDREQAIHVATAESEVSLVPGTEAVVTHEPAWDLDSCYPGRKVGLIIDGGPHSGLRVSINRLCLREK